MSKHMHRAHQKSFHGTATVGEKGQIVIPNEARKNMKLKKGDRLLVFGMGGDMIALMRLSQMEKIASHLSERLKMIDNAIKKAK